MSGLEYIVINLAILHLYAVVVPVPFGSAKDEIEEVLNNIKVNFFIFERGAYAHRDSLAITNNYLQKELFIYKLKTTGKISADFYKINPALSAFLRETTGKNKGVVLSHQSIIQRTSAANYGLKIKPDEQIIWVLSMSFHFVVTILYSCVAAQLLS